MTTIKKSILDMMSKEKQQAMKTCFDELYLRFWCEQTEEQKKITSTIFFSREHSTSMVNIGLWLGVFLHNFFTWTNLAKGLHICSYSITGVQRAVDVALLGEFFRCLHTCTYNFATELDFRHSYAFWKIFKQCSINSIQRSLQIDRLLSRRA